MTHIINGLLAGLLLLHCLCKLVISPTEYVHFDTVGKPSHSAQKGAKSMFPCFNSLLRPLREMNLGQ